MSFYIKFTSDTRIGLCNHLGPFTTEEEAEAKLLEEGFTVREWRKGDYDRAVILNEKDRQAELDMI